MSQLNKKIISNGATNLTNIDKFYGLNLNDTGATEVELGEATKMINFRITRNYKLQKINGYHKIYEVKDKPIRAMWSGKLGATDVFIYIADGKVFNKGTQVGTLTDDVTSIFEFDKKLYFLNGHEYKEYDGTTFKEVEGYIPLVMISTTPGGVGTVLEPANMLTGKKHQTFSSDGTTKTYKLTESNVDSIDKVLVNGEVKATNWYTKDLTNGSITFDNAQSQGTDNIDIYWTKGSGERSHIYKNYYATSYGLADDTRVFIYGNKDEKNRIYFSDLQDGLKKADYFPYTNFIDVGSSNYAVTNIGRQYDRIIISKENETYYANYEQITDTSGETLTTFSCYPLNTAHGMVAKGQGQLLDNYVTTVDSSIVMWTNTNTKDERNAQIISSKIQEWLNDKDLSKAVTCDYQELKEYWLAVDNEIMIYNYENGTFYLLKLPYKVTTLLVNKTIYLGNEKGEINEFGADDTTFSGKIIEAEWHSGYYDFGYEELRKTMRILWVSIKPAINTSLKINYVSDRDANTNGREEKQIESYNFSYLYWNYADFTYQTNYSIKPFRIKLKAKKFAFLKIIISNDKKNDKLTVNTLSIQKTFGAKVK